MKTPKDKWVWMPHPAHFICSKDCQFFMATKVGKYIVSTVGQYWPDRQVREIHASIHDPKWHTANKDRKGDDYDHAYMKRFGFKDIGYNRKFETMVFKARKMPKDEGCPACSHAIVVSEVFDEEYYNEPEDAYKGHMKLCRKYANK